MFVEFCLLSSLSPLSQPLNIQSVPWAAKGKGSVGAGEGGRGALARGQTADGSVQAYDGSIGVGLPFGVDLFLVSLCEVCSHFQPFRLCVLSP